MISTVAVTLHEVISISPWIGNDLTPELFCPFWLGASRA